MSFSLYFYSQQEEAIITAEELKKVLLPNPYIRYTENGPVTDFEYENPITGVYFWFTYTLPGYANEEIALFEGYRYTGLTFCINYNRPSYFMYEANPLLLDLIRTLDIAVFDPQADGVSTLPFRPFADELVRSWQASNRRIGSKAPNRVALQKEKARYAWEYLYRYPQIKTLFPQDHFIPKLFFVHLRDSSVKTAVVFPYPDVESQLIPEVDYLYVKIKRKHWLFDRNVEGLVSFQCLLDSIPEAFEFFSDPVPHYLLKKRELIATALPGCLLIQRDKFSVLANDAFVDIDPPVTA